VFDLGKVLNAILMRTVTALSESLRDQSWVRTSRRISSAKCKR